MENLTFLMFIYVFVLAIFVGFELITKVPPTLHTPLMSGSNAISGITIVGALLSAGYGAIYDQYNTRNGRRNFCNDKCCWGISCNRQNAKNVQKEKVR